MAKSPTLKALQDADDLLKLLTGKRIKDVVPKAIELFGEDLVKKFMKVPPVAFNANDPYSILEIRPGASDFIVNAAYRALAKKYHPDVQGTGNEEKFKIIQGAYDDIMKGGRDV